MDRFPTLIFEQNIRQVSYSYHMNEISLKKAERGVYYDTFV